MESSLLSPPHERHPEALVIEERDALLVESSVLAFEDFPIAVLYTNQARQIVWANAAARALFEGVSGDQVWGLRPGEAFGCAHARGAVDGCGTSERCATCGSAHALAAAAGGSAYEEAIVLRRDERSSSEALELQVWAKPFDLRERRYILYTARNISSNRRRETLERIFYHDLVNTANGLRGILGIVEAAPGERNGLYLDLARSASEQLVEEVESQKALQAAEDRSLRMAPQEIAAANAVAEVMEFFHYPLHSREMAIEVDADSEDFSFRSDKALLRRILVNMVKNAIEASRSGDRVIMGYGVSTAGTPGGDRARFWVWNRAALEERAREHVFERSFSTKGPGRGYGTYGMRLLAERYLGGRVSYESSPETGTRFEADFPLTSSVEG